MTFLSWFGFNQGIRTSKDAEGWHQRLNYQAANLEPESRLLKLQSKLVREGKLQ
jgi:hypothetical protein